MRYILALLISFTSTLLFAQTGSIKGNIKSEEGPLPFVNIQLKNTGLGGYTDTNGRFEIKQVPYGEYVVVASAVGYETIERKISLSKSKSSVTVSYDLTASVSEMEAIVVSVPGGKLQNDLVVNVERSSLEDLQSVSSNTLAESITNLPGVSQFSTGNSIGKPVIRGLTSNRVVTYAQGVRIENQQWGAEHGLGVSNNGVSNVELIKGPASLLYGSDAIGGVLYFVDENFTQKKLELSAESNFFTNSLNTQNKIGVKTNLGAIRLNAFAGFNGAADYKTAEGNRVFNTRFNETNAKIVLGFNTLRNTQTRVTYAYLNNFFGITADKPYSNNTARDFVLPFQDVTQNNLSVENNISLGTSQVNLTFGYGNNDRQEFNDVETVADLHLNLNVYTYNVKASNLFRTAHSDLVVGSQGIYQTNTNKGATFLIPDGQSSELGAYSLFNLYFGKFDVQLGARYDSKNLQASSVEIDGETNFQDFDNTFNTLNYSFGSKYNAHPFVVRFNVASGFRAPTTSELLSNGEHGGVGRIEVGDVNLKSEQALQVDFSVQYDKSGFTAYINPFYNTISKYIFLAPTSRFGAENLPIFEYLQDDARLFGGEASIGFTPQNLSKLSLSSNLSYTQGLDSKDNPLPLIPPLNIRSKAEYKLDMGSQFKLKSGFVQVDNFFAQDKVSQFETVTGAYTLVNAGIALNYKKVDFNFTVKNILNVNYVDHLSRLKTTFDNLVIANPGIDFVFGAKVRF